MWWDLANTPINLRAASDGWPAAELLASQERFAS